jgi:hypothetical protein
MQDKVFYENTDINIRQIIFITVSIILILLVIFVVMNEFFIASKEDQLYQSVLSAESPELREIRAREAQALHRYKVIDAENGVYQIPIDQAMKILADKAFQKRLDAN